MERYAPTPLPVDSFTYGLLPWEHPFPLKPRKGRRHTSRADHPSARLRNGRANISCHEARNNDFFLLGELHGDNQIPALLRTLLVPAREARLPAHRQKSAHGQLISSSSPPR